MENGKSRGRRAIDLEQLGEQSVDDVRRRFDGKWVLMRVTECNQYSTPVRGYVVAVGKKRQDIQEVEFKLVMAARETGEHYYVFRGFEPIPHGEVGDRILENALRPRKRRGSAQ